MLKIKKLDDSATIPTKANKTDAGYDLYALSSGQVPVGFTEKIRTGVAFGFPDYAFGLIMDRSSMGSKGIKVMGGVIDNGYTGEIIVCLCNMGNHTYSYNKGDKIAQIVLAPVIEATIDVVDSLVETDRSSKGFGSSGV